MTMLMALLLAAAGPNDAETPAYRDLGLPLTLASEEQGYQEPEIRREATSRDSRESSQKFILSFGLIGRWTTPFGYANRDVYAVDNPGGGLILLFDSNLRWNDLFDSGWGTALTAEFTLVQGGRTGGTGRSRGKFSAGGYITFTQDHFGGDTVSDNFGNRFSTDDLTMNTYIVGGSAYQSMGDGVFVDGHFGIGAVHYAQVDAVYTFTGNNSFRGEFLEDTWNLALELRVGTGYTFGPLAVTIGMGSRMLMPPNNAGSVDLDSGMFFTFDIDLGIELGF